jgi:hypothetical protein
MQPYAGAGALGEFLTLAEVEISDSSAWIEAVKRPYFDYQSIHFQNDLSLKGVELIDQEVRPGHVLPINVYWQTLSNSVDMQNVTYTITLRNPNGDVINQIDGTPGVKWLSDWPEDAPIRKFSGLYFRPETEPGRYLLEWQLQDGESIVPGRPFLRPWYTDSVTLGEINVIPWPLETDLPQYVTQVQAQFGDMIQLYGYTLTQSADALQLTLTWQAQSVPDKSYMIFIHLVDQNGNIVQQRDIIPVDGLRPTAGWRAGEVLTDVHTIPLPDTLPAGPYSLRLGLYEPDSFVRLPILFEGSQQANDQLNLRTITLP